MGFFDRFRRESKKPTPPTVGEQLAANDATTTADRPDFTLSLPFRWDSVDAKKGYEFRNRTLPEQVIVTAIRHKRVLLDGELESVLSQLVEARSSAMVEISCGKGRFGETFLRSGNGQVEARVVGEDSANGVRIAFAIWVTDTKSVTVALNRYMMEEVGVPFNDYAAIIFDLFQIKDA